MRLNNRVTYYYLFVLGLITSQHLTTSQKMQNRMKEIEQFGKIHNNQQSIMREEKDKRTIDITQKLECFN